MIWPRTPQDHRLARGGASPVRMVMSAGDRFAPRRARPRPIGTVYHPAAYARGPMASQAATSAIAVKSHGKGR